MEINGFDTLGELQKQFPIGTAVEWQEPYSYTAFFYNEKDLQLWRKQEGIASVEIIGENMVKLRPKDSQLQLSPVIYLTEKNGGLLMRHGMAGQNGKGID